jgi:hypothetical protein
MTFYSTYLSQLNAGRNRSIPLFFAQLNTRMEPTHSSGMEPLYSIPLRSRTERFHFYRMPAPVFYSPRAAKFVFLYISSMCFSRSSQNMGELYGYGQIELGLHKTYLVWNSKQHSKDSTNFIKYLDVDNVILNQYAKTQLKTHYIWGYTKMT